MQHKDKIDKVFASAEASDLLSWMQAMPMWTKSLRWLCSTASGLQSRRMKPFQPTRNATGTPLHPIVVPLRQRLRHLLSLLRHPNLFLTQLCPSVPLSVFVS